MYGVKSKFLVSVGCSEAEWIMLSCLHCAPSLSLPQQMAPPQEWAQDRRVSAQQLCFSLTNSSFTYCLFFPPFTRQSLQSQQTGGSQGEFSVLPPEHQSPFVGVGVRTSVSPVPSPSLKAHRGIVEQSEGQEECLGRENTNKIRESSDRDWIAGSDM